MIRATMAVAAVGSQRHWRAERSRQARFARLVALVLDSIFVSILGAVATAVYGVTVVISGTPPVGGGGFSFWTGQTAIPAIYTVLIWLGYYAVCEAMFSATPGKAMNGLRVVSVDGRPLTLVRVVVRNALRLVDVLPGAYVLGGALVLLSPDSQRLGDLAGRTTVVFRQHAVEPGTMRTSGRAARLAFVSVVIAAFLFTAGFDYFARPALVIESQYNQHQLGDQSVVSYSLGRPARTVGTITYPITARTPTQSCHGTVVLYWNWLFGWRVNDVNLSCSPS